MQLGLINEKLFQELLSWRIKYPIAIRNNENINELTQKEYFESVSKDKTKRPFFIYDENISNFNPIGYVELKNIDFINKSAEISLILKPKECKKGYGAQAVKEILNVAFNELGLNIVYGECFECNKPGIKFWNKIINLYKADKWIKPNRKYFYNQYWYSMEFQIEAQNFFDIIKGDKEWLY